MTDAYSNPMAPLRTPLSRAHLWSFSPQLKGLKGLEVTALPAEDGSDKEDISVIDIRGKHRLWITRMPLSRLAAVLT